MDIYDDEGNPIDSHGNIIHNPWVHEGLKEEEWYAMKASEEGEARERWEKVDSEYQKYKSENISIDKKYTDIHKIKFNNFKPFGNKIQSFSKKPITLIYGPNSIGKSSLIHLNAYIRYIFETKSFDLSNTDMFGDNINLGGFDKFIHKRDKNNSIKIEFEFDNCSEAILEYLKPNKIDLKYIKELRKFNKDNLIDIINSSDEYLHTDFARLKSVRGSKRFKENSQNRKSNQLSNKIYKEEFEHFSSVSGSDINNISGRINILTPHEDDSYYDLHLSTSIIEHKGLSYRSIGYKTSYVIDEYLDEYYQSYVFKDAKYYDKNYGQESIYDYLGKKDQFKNVDIEKHFISNILIPKYINAEKYRLLMGFKKSNFDQKYINLTSEEIEYIAQKAIDRIEMEYSIFQFQEKLLNTKIPLKISLEIKYSLKLNQIFLKKVVYSIQNTLYDVVDKIELEHEDGVDFFTAAASYDDYSIYEYNDFVDSDNLTNKGEFGTPPIFHNIPEVYKRYLLFNGSESLGNKERDGLENRAKSEHSELESEYEAIFLSYKNGYNKLIGAFNDMIHFDTMQYIGPLRFYPERDSTIKELDSNESITPDSKTSWSLLKRDKELRNTINEWLKDPEKLKTPYEIQYRKLYDIESSFYDLDFEKLATIKFEVMQDIETKNKDIKRFGITPEIPDDINIIEEFAYDLLVVEKGGDVSLLELESFTQKIKGLILFSALSEKEKLRNSLMDKGFIDILDLTETKEELVFEDLRNNTQISNRDLGLGISQILPVLIVTNRNKNMTIAIEQPELHLHPAVQCEVADEFIRSYKENNNEFLIETHSEHLLLRIMKRMRHTAEGRIAKDDVLALTPDDVCLLYVDSDGENTFINELELDGDGTLLDPWPNGFFEEGHRERFD